MTTCRINRLFFVLFFSTLFASTGQAQSLPKDSLLQMEQFIKQTIGNEVRTGRIKIDSVAIEKRKIALFASATLSYIPFTAELSEKIHTGLVRYLPPEYRKHKLTVYSDGYSLDEYIPFTRKERFENKHKKSLTTNLSRPFTIEKGLINRHIALWQSHGWYYEQKLSRWEWQRARIFQTVEDLYTQSYVLPFLVPMLENAGAHVLLPRERDFQKQEVIVDNDRSANQSVYSESSGDEAWEMGDKPGFAHLKPFYINGENPFRTGSFKQTKTIRKGKESYAEWIPDIPQKGDYAVYISYASLPKSSQDAHYTVYHAGGHTQFTVDQTMGGGTWIYLGTFAFEEGKNDTGRVVLSNLSSKKGRILTADAVKIGGGMGNIARSPHPEGLVTANIKSSDASSDSSAVQLPPIPFKEETSGYPRYTEGARYWLQWAGAPDSIYNWSEGKNDYTDDYQSRGLWVNYLAGGSEVIPKQEGLNIPIDLAFAFHTDAGTTYNDSIIGTLSICMTHINDELFANKKPRILSRDLTSCITDEIIADIRRIYEPNWTRRQLWNRSYSEARIPEVPTMLLELLSHQNFADMKYGLDPNFRFTVSRSIYKGMLKFLAFQNKTEAVIQPLPIHSFSADFTTETRIQLKWQPTHDPVEPSATPTGYILYTRMDGQGFDNGVYIKGNQTEIEVSKDRIYSFKITAVNDGGESFPSEILSACRKTDERGCVLVVNGFERLSAPYSFASTDSIAGFVTKIDHGVPYMNDYSYIGSQYEYRRKIPWMDDDSPGFGGSHGNFETTVIAGNTFDFPYIHGLAITQAGYSFISTSVKAVMQEAIELNTYPIVDLILGKQRQTKIGTGFSGTAYKTFPKELQSCLQAYCEQGGNIIASGAYIGSDLWDSETIDPEDKQFAMNVLKYQWRTGQAAVNGEVKNVASPFPSFDGVYHFYNQLNEISYVVESPDGIEPAGANSFTIFRYNENNISAGIASHGKYKTCILGFPIETIQTETARAHLMKSILDFMENPSNQ